MRALFALLLLFAAGEAAAEPYLAQREGEKCSRCHVNRTGGGKRTDAGFQYALTHLDLGRWSAPPVIDPRLGEHVGLGADLRLSNATVFADQVHNTFDSQEADLYVQADLGPYLTLYLDTSVAGGSAESREAFLLLAASGFSLKAGYLLLPYGWRVWGDGEFIRAETGYNFAAPDLGVELGFERGPFSIYLAASNGSGGRTDEDTFKKLSGLGEVNLGAFRLGWSGSYNRTAPRISVATGPFIGVTLGRLALLGEADLLVTRFRRERQTVHALVTYLEAGLLVRRGLHVRASWGYHDPAADVEEDQRLSVRGTIELFPLPLLGLTASYTVRASVPQDEVGNADTLVVEAHVFF